MELEAQIFDVGLDREEFLISVIIQKKDIAKVINDTCYSALRKIREILAVDDMPDSMRIDKLVDIMIQLEGEHEAWGLPPLSAVIKK